MSLNPRWTRRTFLSTAGLFAGAWAVPPPVAALGERPPSRPVLAFVAHRAVNGNMPGIRTNAIHGARWSVRHPDLKVSNAPRVLAVHPTRPILYAAFAATSTTSATLSSFLIDAAAERETLRPLNEQPLSIATTIPNDLAVNPDGRLLITVDRRGQLSLHPLAADGAILPLRHVRQLIGTGVNRPTRPHSLLLHAHAPVAYVTDPGSRRLALLDLTEPALLPPLDLPDFLSPGCLALHPSGRLLAFTSPSSQHLALLPLHPITGHPIPELLALHALVDSGRPGAIAFSQSSNELFLTLHSEARTSLQVFQLTPEGLIPTRCSFLTRPVSAGRLWQHGPALLYTDQHAIHTVDRSTLSGQRGIAVNVHPYPQITSAAFLPG